MRKSGLIILAATSLFALNACVTVHNSGTGSTGSTGTSETRVQASIDQVFRTSDKDDSIRVYTSGRSDDPNKVQVCLRNSASGKNKGLHFKKTKKPRYVTKKKGDTNCAEHPAGPHSVTWRFWKTKGFKMKRVGSYKLNATDFAGQRIIFDWYHD